MRTAFDIARHGRPGPGRGRHPARRAARAGRLPGRRSPRRCTGTRSASTRSRRASISPADAEAFFKLLAASERPLLYVGGGVINGNAAPELRAFAAALRHPVVTTLLGIGAIDTTSELSLQMLGMHGMAYANYAVEDCDFLIAVGSRFDDRVAGKVKEFAPRATIAHLDIDASEIGKVKNVDWAHVADCKPGLRSSWKPAPDSRRASGRGRAYVTELKRQHALNYNRGLGPDPGRGRAGGAEQDHPRRRDRLHRRRPASDVGRAVSRLRGAAHLAHVRQHGHHGVRAARRHRGAARQPGQARHRRRRRRQHPDEPGRAGDAHHLRHPGEGAAAEQSRRRHGPPVAGPVLRQPLLRAPTRRCTRRTSSRPPRPTASASRGASPSPRDLPGAARRVRALRGPGLPRGHGGPRRARLPDGRAGHGLQGHDHRQVDPGTRDAAVAAASIPPAACSEPR